MLFIYDDGGRRESGYKGKIAHDCVCRAIAIATQRPYGAIYNELLLLGSSERIDKRQKRASDPSTGMYKKTYKRYLKSLGWSWHPTMGIGSGCRVHLKDGELPAQGRLIVALSRHLCAVI